MSGRTESAARRATLLADANVLIDFRDAEAMSLLALVAQHVGPLLVTSNVLGEVRGIDEEDCAQLEITVLSPSTEQLQRAGNLRLGISLPDAVCLVVCLDGGWTCVTNDRALRRQCSLHGIPIRYGLRLLVDLVEVGAISRGHAELVAGRIHEANPLHINRRVIERFMAGLNGVGSR